MIDVLYILAVNIYLNCLIVLKNRAIHYQTALATKDPNKEGMKYQIIIATSMSTNRSITFAISPFPTSLESMTIGFQDHCSLPEGSGTLGYALGSDLPSPAFLF